MCLLYPNCFSCLRHSVALEFCIIIINDKMLREGAELDMGLALVCDKKGTAWSADGHLHISPKPTIATVLKFYNKSWAMFYYITRYM